MKEQFLMKVENIVAEEEIAHQFLLLSQWFHKSSASVCMRERVNVFCFRYLV